MPSTPRMPDRLGRVTARTRAFRGVRCLAGRCIALTRSDVLTAENNDGDSSAPERQLRYRRLAAVVWSRDLVEGIPAPRPHRFNSHPNRGALYESTPHHGVRSRRHTICRRNTGCFSGFVFAASGRMPVDPARTLPHHHPNSTRHACVSRAFRAVKLWFPGSSDGWSDRDLMQKGRPQAGRRPNSHSLIGPAHRPDDGQSSGRSTRGRRSGALVAHPHTYGARR